MEDVVAPQPGSHRNCFISESHAYELQVPVPSTAKLEATACSLCNSLANPVHPDGNSLLAGVAQWWLAETQCGFEHVCHPTYAESCLASYFLHWAQARTGTCRQHRSAKLRLNHAMLAQTYAAEGSQTVVNNSAIYKFLHNYVGVTTLLLQLCWPQLRDCGQLNIAVVMLNVWSWELDAWEVARTVLASCSTVSRCCSHNTAVLGC